MTVNRTILNVTGFVDAHVCSALTTALFLRCRACPDNRHIHSIIRKPRLAAEFGREVLGKRQDSDLEAGATELGAGGS